MMRRGKGRTAHPAVSPHAYSSLVTPSPLYNIYAALHQCGYSNGDIALFASSVVRCTFLLDAEIKKGSPEILISLANFIALRQRITGRGNGAAGSDESHVALIYTA
jgi:hypothetical protein